VKDNCQKRLVDLYTSVVFDEAQLPELGHEHIHARTRRADHFRQGLLRNFLKYLLGLAFLAITSKQKQCSGQSLLRRIEELID
jgi:hypothetical protein